MSLPEEERELQEHETRRFQVETSRCRIPYPQANKIEGDVHVHWVRADHQVRGYECMGLGENAPMTLSLISPLPIEECQRRLADPRTFEGTRFRGDTWSGGALDLLLPHQFRVRWRWGPLSPVLFVGTLTRSSGGRTGIEGRLEPHPLLEGALILSLLFSVIFPGDVLLILAFVGLAELVAVLGCCASPLASWLLAAVILLAGIAALILGGRHLTRQAQDHVMRFLHDAIHASRPESA